jgi:DNA replication protein DnaC
MHAKARWKSESFEGWFWETGRARFVKATELARLSYYGEETRDKLDALVIVPMLVVDDLGAEQTSDGWRSTLLDVLDARVREGNRTCITTNLSEKPKPGERRFSEHVGERVFRRLKDFGHFVAVNEKSKAEAA